MPSPLMAIRRRLLRYTLPMNRPSPQRRQTVTQELIAGLGLGLLYPFGIAKPSLVARPKERGDHTVVLVHGFLGNRSCFLPLQSYLRLHGIKNIVTYQYRSRGSIEGAAIGLKTFLKRSAQGGKVSLVAHSMGGLVAQCYIQMLGGVRRTRQLITIGTPFSGTYNAYWMPTRMGDQLRPNSDFLQKLQQTQHISEELPYTTILGGSDNIILPREQLGSTQEKTFKVEKTGHFGLLWSPRVMQKVLQEIKSRASV